MNLMIIIRVKYWVKDHFLFVCVLGLNVWILMKYYYIHIFKILHIYFNKYNIYEFNY